MCITLLSLDSLMDIADYFVQFFVEFRVLISEFLDFPYAVNDGCMVFSTEFFADFRKGGLGQFFGKDTWRFDGERKLSENCSSI